VLTVALAILPIIIAIAVGYVLKVRGVPAAAWSAAEKSVFYVFLPALMVHHVSVRDVAVGEVLAMLLPVCGIIIGLGVVGYWSARWLTRSPPPTAASVHQGSIRLNGVVMIALVPALLGEGVWPYIVVMTSVWPALSNTTSIVVFANAAGLTRSPRKLALAILKNPVVIAVAMGTTFNVAGLGPVIETLGVFKLLGNAALPVGLLAAGAALEFSSLRSSGPPTLLATVLKLAVMPAVMWLMCDALGLPLLITQVMVISSALPCSPSSYVLASQMGGDGKTMASTITLQHVVGMVSVALVAGWMLAQ
jgi:malonate transporter and related proteins